MLLNISSKCVLMILSLLVQWTFLIKDGVGHVDKRLIQVLLNDVQIARIVHGVVVALSRPDWQN